MSVFSGGVFVSDCFAGELESQLFDGFNPVEQVDSG